MKILHHSLIVLFVLVITGCGGPPAPAEPPVLTCPAAPTGAMVTISGTTTYDFVPHSTNANEFGLNYNAIQQRPVRGVTVQALNSSNNAVISSTTSTSSGGYSLSVPNNTNVTIRVLAELRQTSPISTFRLVDNTAGNAQWAMQGAQACTGTTAQTRNLNAASGWDGSVYARPRSAAPFAILDAVYDAVSLIRTSAPTTNFPALDLNWSPNNIPSGNNNAVGQIGTSHYNGTGIYILGAANIDTDEYDRHVIIHEFGHYFEDMFSRSDSIGGSHSATERLDMRLAFGEGFGNAFSAMVSGDPSYKDTIGPNQSGGFGFSLETNPSANIGWFNEGSVQSILYDLYDIPSDGADTVSMGFTPLYTVLVNQQRTTPALTSIFTFITALKANNLGQATAIDQLVSAQVIVSATMDAYGTTETNTGGLATGGALPIYTPITVGGTTTAPLCTTATITNGIPEVPNKLGNRRFLRLNITTAGERTVIVIGEPGSDPDIFLYANGILLQPAIAVGTTDSLVRNLPVGDYVIEVYDDNLLSGTRAGPSCFTVTIN